MTLLGEPSGVRRVCEMEQLSDTRPLTRLGSPSTNHQGNSPMLEPITIRYEFRPARRSLATGQAADLFGLSGTEPPHLVAEKLRLDVRPGDLVLFTGPSGSGKSSILRESSEQLAAIDAMSLELPDAPLIDALPGAVNERLDLLAACGLSEARLLLRSPRELSDGQRYRFRLAFALASPASYLMADEFAAYLDRTLAKVLAFNLRKLVTRTGKGILLATTHEDLTDDLQPDLWVRCLGEGQVETRREPLKKNRSASRTSFGSRRVPEPTGRPSLGGITAAITSPTSNESSSSGMGTSPSASVSSRLPRLP